jgi:DivIVA domain-containing protein
VDREAIERRDFPVGRRGYDPKAVDAHLRRVADELEALRAHVAAPRSPLAASTSDQVRQILEAAEAGAADLRADAGRQAGDHVARVQHAAAAMLSRLDELERELGTLLNALRQSGERLDHGLAQLQRQAGELDDALATPADSIAAADEAAPTERVAAAGSAGADDEVIAAREVEAADEVGAAPGNGVPADDEAGARLIALNMALSGSSREETARYLAEHFALPDADTLLDDVYDRAGR